MNDFHILLKMLFCVVRHIRYRLNLKIVFSLWAPPTHRIDILRNAEPYVYFCSFPLMFCIWSAALAPRAKLLTLYWIMFLSLSQSSPGYHASRYWMSFDCVFLKLIQCIERTSFISFECFNWICICIWMYVCFCSEPLRC